MSHKKPMDEFPLLKETEGVPLFYPHVPKRASSLVSDTLTGRWIGQGPKVDFFEKKFVDAMEINGYPLAVSSGTAALHLAYILSGVRPNDEVICPVFTCTATNLPILYLGAKPVFVDVQENELNVDVDRIEQLITPKTKAISVVDYGGKPNDYKRLRSLCDRYKLSLIADCAHAIDGKFNGQHVSTYADFTMFSFQAIKTMTTGDGGMLIVRDQTLLEKGKRLRWFGIDRSEKQKGTWENDICELGYKYQMTDVAASIGLAGLETIKEVLSQRRRLAKIYFDRFAADDVHVFEAFNKTEKDFTPWMITINTKGRREEVMNHLRSLGIESAQVHYRNDRYSVFGDQDKSRFPNMNLLEDNYLVLPLHTKMTDHDAHRVAKEASRALSGKI